MVTGIACLVYSVSYTQWPTSLNVIIIVTILNMPCLSLFSYFKPNLLSRETSDSRLVAAADRNFPNGCRVYEENLIKA